MPNPTQRFRTGLHGSRHEQPQSSPAAHPTNGTSHYGNDGNSSGRYNTAGRRRGDRSSGRQQQRAGPQRHGDRVEARQEGQLASRPWRQAREVDHDEKKPMQSRSGNSSRSRLRPVRMDSLAEVGLPSKGDTRLLDHARQELYFQQVVTRYESLYGSLPEPNSQELCDDSSEKRSIQDEKVDPSFANLAKPSSANFVHQTVSHAATGGQAGVLITAMRGLREGLLASRRCDIFTVKAYLFIVRAGIHSRFGFETYIPALVQLLDRIYGSHSQQISTDEGDQFRLPEQDFLEGRGKIYLELMTYRILDLSCRRREFSGALESLHILKLKGCLNTGARWVWGIVKALIGGDWVVFWRNQRLADAYQRSLVEPAECTMVRHAIQCLGKTYLMVSKEYVHFCTKQDVELLAAQQKLDWTLDNEKVIIRHVNRR